MWGVYLTRASARPVSLWGPVVTDRTEPDWIGAFLPTNNTGEISAFYHALKWIRVSDGISSKPVRRRLNLITDSEYLSRRAAIRFSFSTSVVFFKRSAHIMTLPFPGSRRIRVAPLPKPWAMRRRTYWRPGALGLFQCGRPSSGSAPSLPAPPFFLPLGPSPSLGSRGPGPTEGPPPFAGNTLPVASSSRCSFAPSRYLS